MDVRVPGKSAIEVETIRRAIWRPLPNSPAQARWLSDEQRTWLVGRLAEEKALVRTAPLMPLLAIILTHVSCAPMLTMHMVAPLRCP